MGLTLKFIVLVMLFCLPVTCFAEQLKIVDTMGLTRAVKKTDGAVVVLVKTRTVGPISAISLTNVDGILPDIPGSDDGKGSFRFDGVREGTWRITSTLKIDIAQVSIEE